MLASESYETQPLNKDNQRRVEAIDTARSNGYFVDRFYRSVTIERHEEHPLEVHEVSKNKRVFKQEVTGTSS